MIATETFRQAHVTLVTMKIIWLVANSTQSTGVAVKKGPYLTLFLVQSAYGAEIRLENCVTLKAMAWRLVLLSFAIGTDDFWYIFGTGFMPRLGIVLF